MADDAVVHETSDEPNDERPRVAQRRLLVSVSALLTVLFLALCGRLFCLQVLESDVYRERARRGVARSDPIRAYPGDVRTHDGVLLARSLRAADLGLDLRALSEDEIPSFVAALAEALELPAATRRDCMRGASERKQQGRTYSPLARGVEVEKLHDVIAAANLEIGSARRARVLVIDPVTTRTYPRGELLCHVVGARARDGSGFEGIERSAQRYMQPKNGQREVFTDAREEFRFFYPEHVEVAPVNGYDAWLTIDVRAQRIVEEELAAGLARHQGEAALAILMNCRDASVLALSCLPAFDPNRYHEYPAEELARRRKNRVVENVYEPGSVIKPFVAALALEKGLATRSDPIWGGGRRHAIGGRVITDVSDHGPINVEDAIVYSSNIGMAILGTKLGPDGLLEMIDTFGFCRPTGIELPFEEGGRHTSRKDWNLVHSTVSVSYGYEVLISPIQLATALCALVNGGELYRPRIIDRFQIEGRVVPRAATLVRRVVSEETSRHVREIMRSVVEKGTAQYLKFEGFDFGGKTGTADMDPRYTKRDYLASFEAFAPFENPEVVCLVMIEKPRSGKIYGGSVSGPVVARIFKRWFRIESDPVFLRNRWPGW